MFKASIVYCPDLRPLVSVPLEPGKSASEDSQDQVRNSASSIRSMARGYTRLVSILRLARNDRFDPIRRIIRYDTIRYADDTHLAKKNKHPSMGNNVITCFIPA